MVMKKVLRVLFVFGLLCFCFAHVAVADSATAGASTMTVFDDVVHLLAYTLGTIILGLSTLGAHKLQQKWGIQVPDAWLAKTQSVIDMGIAYAEEQAHKAAEGTEIASNDKLDMASKFVLRLSGDDKRLVKLGEEKIKQMIEARLNQSRATPFTSVMLATDTPKEEVKS